MKMKASRISPNIQAFVEFHHGMYGRCLENGDLGGRAESGGALCISYAAMGNGELAQRWAEEYFACISEQSAATHSSSQLK